ncbi:MAG: DUF4261 domain-containing protein [Gemmataceae bacterium]|nr:DUF4261 domain-containing protein [Gemmataceae bacterium]
MCSADKYGVAIHYVIGTGWVHTHGMDRHGLPELEVRGVPGLLAERAGEVINEVCAYMIDRRAKVRPGETMELSPLTRFRFEVADPLPGEEEHYRTQRWLLADIGDTCSCCGQYECGAA